MAAIRAKNTRPEMLVRSALHRAGFRFRLHVKTLPGKPDLVLRKYRAVVFVHGCFWHGHECSAFRWPETRAEEWRAKIEGNVERDSLIRLRLSALGWRVAVIWECALGGRARLPFPGIVECLGLWLRSGGNMLEIRGDEARTAR